MKDKDAKWEPAITSISMLSDDEKTLRLGLMPTAGALLLDRLSGTFKVLVYAGASICSYRPDSDIC